MSDNDNLFRQEALDASKHSLMGSVTLYTPPWRWLVISLVAALIVGTVCFMFFGTYTKRERVVGQLVPMDGLMNVLPIATGTISRVLVREGQVVQKDQILAEISTDVATTGIAATRQLVSEQLQDQKSRLQIDLSSQGKLSAEESRGLQVRSGMLRDQLQQIDQQTAHRRRQVELARQQLEKLQVMREKGYVSNSQQQQQEGALLEAESQLQGSLRQRLDTEQQLTSVEQQLRQLPLNAESQRHDIQRKLAELNQSLAENESRRASVLRAPQDGVVTSVLSKAGQTVQAGQQVVTILPQGSKLEAQLMVPSRAVGFIATGSRVVLRYQAYPYQKFGQQYGRVTEISRSALTPVEVATLTGQRDVTEQNYRVVVALDGQTISAYGRQESLKPGMALEADILIDNRRLIEWVFEPLYALGRRVID
ncbi:HlyD family secretion protein [Andreprevotia chitinilytica]|uniref:HlyD family secretion protein n=1 Tax=Andreprevotia chitinilytica TaxID=396808 RepID=UPI0005549AEA|nr:HlyD family efflux transporter periplasmic adaptor subunit [Andreprevotia chitinilytica]